MTDAPYSGGNAVSDPQPHEDMRMFAERYTKDGVPGWLFLEDGKPWRWMDQENARRLARHILFSVEH